MWAPLSWAQQGLSRGQDSSRSCGSKLLLQHGTGCHIYEATDSLTFTQLPSSGLVWFAWKYLADWRILGRRAIIYTSIYTHRNPFRNKCAVRWVGGGMASTKQNKGQIWRHSTKILSIRNLTQYFVPGVAHSEITRHFPQNFQASFCIPRRRFLKTF